MNHRYSLEEGSKKFACPACNQKTLVLYIDKETDSYVNSDVGRCDREVNCKYHYTPREFIADNNIDHEKPKGHKKRQKNKKIENETNYKPVSEQYFETTTQHPEESNFVKYLLKEFDSQKVNYVCRLFYLGVFKALPGTVIFWQRNINGKTGRGKIMQYDSKRGKRVDIAEGHRIDYVHNYLMLDEATEKGYLESPFVKNRSAKLKDLSSDGKINNYKYPECLFGEHQLINDTSNKPVALVESEKTAIVMTMVSVDCIWMATGSIGGLKSELVKPLKGRKIILFPDLGAYYIWRQKMLFLRRRGFAVSISDILEKTGTKEDHKNGLDIADYFLKAARKPH